ncbi:hypothetical protein [Butyrivibrio sp. AE3003]|uniref:hypothetical protein n=1 Tax=Butyrivibrio sp. AE3003 TaxID=1496721 RepID=UPI00047CC869|nr:hypothetical protein [Butyrivibrio sp. AE3003]
MYSSSSSWHSYSLAVYGNNRTKVYYNLTDTLPDKLGSIQGSKEIDEKFDMNSAYMILVDKNLDSVSMNKMIKELKNTDGIISVLGNRRYHGTCISERVLFLRNISMRSKAMIGK